MKINSQTRKKYKTETHSLKIKSGYNLDKLGQIDDEMETIRNFSDLNSNKESLCEEKRKK